MITADQIGWGTYLDHEGPFYRGNQPYVLPAKPTPEQMYLSVITATEGGSANAINMYDVCGVSLGWIQWCEFGQFSVTGILADCLVTLGYSGFYSNGGKPLADLLERLQASLQKNNSQSYRFYQLKQGVIDTIDKQRKFFFLNASGGLGHWDDESRAYAKTWAATLASVFEDEETKKIQLDYTTSRLSRFILPAAKVLIPWTIDVAPRVTPEAFPWAHVGYAAYLSFAANNPTIACKMFQAYSKDNGLHQTDEGWVIGLLKQLTFGPKITIYPSRYNAIRPVLEKNFGVDLPDFANELEVWQQQIDIPGLHKLDTTRDIQLALISLGYDLGPAGADGIFGPKTRLAVNAFQLKNGLSVTGFVDAATHKALTDYYGASR